MLRNFSYLTGILALTSCFVVGCSDDTGSGASGATGSGASSAGGNSAGGNGGDTTSGFTGGGGSSGTSMGCMKTCADIGAECGMQADGCGGVIDCGTCTAPETCGGGGANKCGTQACVPKTCADLGITCGPAGDGCSSLLDCGSCNLPETCGGNGTPSVCGLDPNCTNLCLQQVTCPTPNTTTTISGTVYAPNGVDPLPNVLVYIPNSAVQPFAPGVACDQCGDSVSGDPLVSTSTDAAGNFVLENVPVGMNIPMVIQTGRWRRQFTIAGTTACVDNPLPTGTARLPKNHNEGDIPLMAFATGQVDALECVMRKIGVEDGEFTNPSGAGRIHFYRGQGASGTRINNQTPNENALWGDATVLDNYDMVLFPCQGNEYLNRLTPQGLQNLIDYTAVGGRVFTTHFSYVWLHGNGDFDGTANWANPIQGTSPTPDPQTGYIDMSFPKGALLAQWLLNIGASTVLGEMEINTLRKNFVSVNPPSQLWIQTNLPTVTPMHYTFNTPVNMPADQQCGRVLFSDFHVENANNTNVVFPTECVGGPMTDQEKMLMFMLFDLGSCVTPDVPTCTPTTCVDQGLMCGFTGDGCGQALDCGPCPMGQNCNNGVCGGGSCTPQTCADQGIECGPAGDGCGNLIPNCGDCALPETCGGAGMAGICGFLG